MANSLWCGLVDWEIDHLPKSCERDMNDEHEDIEILNKENKEDFHGFQSCSHIFITDLSTRVRTLVGIIELVLRTESHYLGYGYLYVHYGYTTSFLQQ